MDQDVKEDNRDLPLPFKTPPRTLNNAAEAKDLEKPKPTELRAVPSSPMTRTLFLPPQSASAILPHMIAVRN